jgi:hypothetical protein
MSTWHYLLCRAITMNSSKPPPLLNLPFEIRQIISIHVFGYGTAQLDVSMELGCDRSGGPATRFFTHLDRGNAVHLHILPTCRSTQMLNTCRKIFEEARPVLVKQTKFVVSPHSSFELLMRVPEPFCNRSHITDLHVELKDNRMAESWAMTDLVLEKFKSLEALIITGFSAEWLRHGGCSKYAQTRQNLLFTLMFKFSVSQMKHLVDLSDHKLGICIVIFDEQ